MSDSKKEGSTEYQMKAIRDFKTSICAILFSVIVTPYSFFSMPVRDTWLDAPGLFPIVCGIFFLFLGIGLLFSSIKRGAIDAYKSARIERKGEGRKLTEGQVRVIVLILSSTVHLLLMGKVNYYISTTIYLAFLLWLFWAREKYVKSIKMILYPLIISAAVTVSLGLIFTRFFNIFLP